MNIQDRVNEIQASVGSNPVEQELLHAPVLHAGPLQTANPGVNQTLKVILETGQVAYFKALAAQSVNHAAAFGHHFTDVPLNEVVAWRLAESLGPPYDELVPPAALRVVTGQPGALVAEKTGGADVAAFQDVDVQCFAAGFWDALIGHQDRHMAQFRYDRVARTLGLIDHGYAFARTGDRLNASEMLTFRRLRCGAAVAAPRSLSLTNCCRAGTSTA